MWFIGCKYDEVIEKVKQVSYQVLPDNKGGVLIDCPVLGKQFTPEEILAEFLHKLLTDGSDYLEQVITQIVITVPVYFNDIQRLAVQKVGNLAGLEVLRIICHPTAAALAYGLEKTNNETILVFDIGAGQLGILCLDGISSAPRGKAQIEVTFDIDNNSILNVTAKDKSSGKEDSITINSDSILSEDEIEKQRDFLLLDTYELSTEN